MFILIVNLYFKSPLYDGTSGHIEGLIKYITQLKVVLIHDGFILFNLIKHISIIK